MLKWSVMLKEIRVKKAAQHNLKRVDVNLPRNKLIVITGPSGSGKSSLAFDTLYAEGQRRYIECLSAYARQYIEHISVNFDRSEDNLFSSPFHGRNCDRGV